MTLRPGLLVVVFICDALHLDWFRLEAKPEIAAAIMRLLADAARG
jgi:hypothetical protein